MQYKPQKESSNESTDTNTSNDPPLLESGAEEKDQYKAYGLVKIWSLKRKTFSEKIVLVEEAYTIL